MTESTFNILHNLLNDITCGKHNRSFPFSWCRSQRDIFILQDIPKYSSLLSAKQLTDVGRMQWERVLAQELDNAVADGWRQSGSSEPFVRGPVDLRFALWSMMSHSALPLNGHVFLTTNIKQMMRNL